MQGSADGKLLRGDIKDRGSLTKTWSLAKTWTWLGRPRSRSSYREGSGLQEARLTPGQGDSLCQAPILFKDRRDILLSSEPHKFISHSVTLCSLRTICWARGCLLNIRHLLEGIPDMLW